MSNMKNFLLAGFIALFAISCSSVKQAETDQTQRAEVLKLKGDWQIASVNYEKGYKIKPLKLEIPDSTFDLKIKIAKNLLRNDVKFKIVAESLEISEEELKDIIYNQTKALSSSYYPYPYKL